MAQQNEIQTQQSYQDYQELLVSLPIRDDSVWIPLQKKKYKEAMDRFYSLLGYYTPKTVSRIFWRSIIEGESVMRGEVSYEEWIREVVPYLAIIFVNIADRKLFERIYLSLQTETLIYFNSLITSGIPGISDDEKIASIEGKKQWLHSFFVGSTLNSLGGLLFKADTSSLYSLANVVERINALDMRQKDAFFSFEIADSIFSICKNEKFSDKETTNVSHFTGLVLLGLENPEKLESHISDICGLPKERVSLVAKKIKQTIIDPLSDETSSLKERIESVIKDSEVVVPIKTEEEKTDAQPIKITKVEFPTRTADGEPNRLVSSGSTIGGTGEPLILHKEENIAAGGGGLTNSPFKKGSIFSFGFFKPGGKKTIEKKEVSVKIESPKQQESIKTQEQKNGKAREQREPKPLEIKTLAIEQKNDNKPKEIINRPLTAPIALKKSPETKNAPVKTESEKPKVSLPVNNIPKPVPVKVQDYNVMPASVETEPSESIKQPKPSTGEKKIHYSAFKTDLPPSQEPPTPKTDPHVDGNVLFFK